MTNMLRNTRHKLHLIRYYSRLFRFTDAVPLVMRKDSSGTKVIYSSYLQKPIVFRPGTTDFDVILKVIGAHEYAFPCRIKPRLIIDAGANIGVSTLYFAHQFPEAQIYAIEPESSNFALLEKNCVGLDNVTLRKAALWHRQTRVTLKDENAEKWAFSVTENTASEAKIPTITIPQLLQEAGQEEIDILKVDIEGAEKELFSKGCEEWLSRVRTLIIELHDRFVPGCSRAFYSSLCAFHFSQEVKGENVFITFDSDPELSIQ